MKRPWCRANSSICRTIFESESAATSNRSKKDCEGSASRWTNYDSFIDVVRGFSAAQRKSRDARCGAAASRSHRDYLWKNCRDRFQYTDCAADHYHDKGHRFEWPPGNSRIHRRPWPFHGARRIEDDVEFARRQKLGSNRRDGGGCRERSEARRMDRRPRMAPGKMGCEAAAEREWIPGKRLIKRSFAE